MNQLIAVTAVVAISLAGVQILNWIWPFIHNIPCCAQLGLGYCVGSALICFILFGEQVLGIAFTRWSLLIPICLLAIAGGMSIFRNCRVKPKWELCVFLAISLLCIAFALSWLRPVYGYDAISMWALKAKITFSAQRWPSTMFDPYTTHNPDYPPLIPSVQAFVFFWLDQFDDVASRVVFPAFFSAGSAILWWLMKHMRANAKGLWLIWWCSLPLFLEQIKITYADLPLAVFLLVMFGGCLAWLRDSQQNEWLKLAGIFAGLAFWVKQDAAMSVGAGFLSLFVIARWKRLSLKPIFRAVVYSVIIAAPWHVFIWSKGLTGDYQFLTSASVEKLWLVISEILNFAFLEGAFVFFWPIFLLVLIFRLKLLKQTCYQWLVLCLAMQFAAVVVIYLSSTLNLEAQLKTSADRVLLTMFVPALLFIAISWRGRITMLRPTWVQVGIVLLVIGCAVTMYRIGSYQKSSEELLGVAISPFPYATLWVWAVAVPIAIVKFYKGRNHRPTALIMRITQTAITVATLGLSLSVISVYARESGELYRRFHGKTLMEKHAVLLDDPLINQIAVALEKLPAGTHVKVRPKRSRRYHQFYYETFPDLIVDDQANIIIDLSRLPEHIFNQQSEGLPRRLQD